MSLGQIYLLPLKSTPHTMTRAERVLACASRAAGAELARPSRGDQARTADQRGAAGPRARGGGGGEGADAGEGRSQTPWQGRALELAHAQVEEKGPGAMAGRREGEEPASPPSLPSVDLVARSLSEEATGGRGAAPQVLDLASARGRRGSRAAGARCRTGTSRRSSKEATGGRGAAPARMGAGLLAVTPLVLVLPNCTCIS